MACVATRNQDSAVHRRDFQSDVAVEDDLQLPTICTMAGKAHIIAEVCITATRFPLTLLQKPAPTEQDLLRRFDATVKDVLSHGLTSVHDAGLKPVSLEFFTRQAAAGNLPFRIYGMRYFNENDPYWGNLSEPIINAGDGRLNARSVKIFADGALRSGGAAVRISLAVFVFFLMSLSSTSRIMINPTRRDMCVDPKVLTDVVPKCLRDGWQVNIHAIGDYTNGVVLDTFEAALKDVDITALRPRLEHAQILTQTDLERVRKLGVTDYPRAGNGSLKPPHRVDFKFEPYNVPATEITKLGLFPSSTGGLGDVWKCSWSRRSQDSEVAVKLARVPQANDTELVNRTSKRIHREAHVWITLEHENILTFNGVVDGFGPLPALVSLWMGNGSLDDYLKRGCVLSKADKPRMGRTMAAGLKYCASKFFSVSGSDMLTDLSVHDKEVVHSDLICTNVLMSADGRFHLADSGLSMILSEAQNSTFSSCHPGNVRWMAPEMLAIPEQGEVAKPTKAADVYLYGCIMLQLFCGRAPYFWLTQANHVIAARMAGTELFVNSLTSKTYTRSIR
ncbi:kinase-like domain-containing protein [Suillus discolor]|uniref:Kinase-like domain-containing protein n=1 Tax=Suillus discolor TaxID=1912936 RepID=A0A9P7JM15_9AGAM|nr:kinase-like domain-containing protein [Suillus discolor]KAG2088085.1 kinase-like domain-containing protein [Suillus discolor]